MNINIGRIARTRAVCPALAALAAVAPAALFAQSGTADSADSARIETESTAAAQTPESVIRKWPELSRNIARKMTERYGPPSHFSRSALVWEENGTWKRSVVFRDAWPHYARLRDKDYLEQTIPYQVPDGKVAALKRFDRRIAIDRTSGELSARSESEKLNYLTLNLADEIITGKRSVEDARDFYRNAEELSKAGKSSQYLDGIIFPIEHEFQSPPMDGAPEIR